MDQYRGRLSIETKTPAESVEHASESEAGNSSVHPYTIRTPRGLIRAGKVVYCTNGYSGHLLPELRGRIHPFKGTMTVQDPENSIPNQGDAISWGFHYPPTFDPRTKRRGYGLYYLGQSAQTGYFYFGGEEARSDESITADDSDVGEYSVQHLQTVLPRFFGKALDTPWRLVSSWSGIMGFSADGLPLVGRLPSSLTGRQGDGEWIAAAFNGYGMANCLLSGEALALMMLGESVSDWFPEAYALEDKRLNQILAPSEAIREMTADYV